MTLNESYFAFNRNRWKILATRNILNITNPDKKNTGTMVSKSITPSNEIKKRSFACLLPILGYKYSAVQIRRTYSTQKMPSVTYSIAFNPIVIRDNSSNVCANVTRIFKTIVIVINISNALLIRLLLSPIWIMLNIFFFNEQSLSNDSDSSISAYF